MWALARGYPSPVGYTIYKCPVHTEEPYRAGALHFLFSTIHRCPLGNVLDNTYTYSMDRKAMYSAFEAKLNSLIEQLPLNSEVKKRLKDTLFELLKIASSNRDLPPLLDTPE